MKRSVVKTADGSTTIRIEDWDENYHSSHGAIQEAYHVFIKSGLDLFPNKSKVSILEIGFGTGLNALITLLEKRNRNLEIDYHGVEAYPVAPAEMEELNYIDQLQHPEAATAFKTMHNTAWDEKVVIEEAFCLTKRKQFFTDITDENTHQLIYFDAFGARVQPDLWTEEIFKQMFLALQPEGVLVTYAAKGSVRRAMLAVGFLVEKLPGPPGKREMLRATKPKE